MKTEENLPGTYVTSTHYPESRDDVALPSKEEYIKSHAPAKRFDEPRKWSEPKYKCSFCGGGMRKNLATVLRSYPTKYVYRCDDCGKEDYLEV